VVSSVKYDSPLFRAFAFRAFGAPGEAWLIFSVERY
jgi:hypothetical protein